MQEPSCQEKGEISNDESIWIHLQEPETQSVANIHTPTSKVIYLQFTYLSTYQGLAGDFRTPIFSAQETFIMIIDVISLQVLGADAFFDSGGEAIDNDDEIAKNKVDIGVKVELEEEEMEGGIVAVKIEEEEVIIFLFCYSTEVNSFNKVFELI